MKSQQASKYFIALKNIQKLGKDICFLNKNSATIFFEEETYYVTAIKILLVRKSVSIYLNKGLLELLFKIL